MRRFALYSDIHGNIAALDAVLGDIEARGVTERYCLGDLVGYGPEPSAVIARVRATGDPVIRGNYDDGVGGRKGSCGCYYGTPEAKTDGEASYAWTDSALDDDEHAYLAGLRDELRFEVGGTRVLLCHGSPRRINEYLMLDRPEWHLAKLAEQADADLICFGHVHLPYHRGVRLESGRIAHFVSDGSVGKSKDGDTRACWAEIVIGSADDIERHVPNDAAAECAGGSWVGVSFHRVAYDVDTVAEAIVAAGLPARLADALRMA
jgi:predicted phosphodiesterase